MNNAIHNIQGYLANPLMLLALFVVASFVMIWRLHAMESKGFEGTVLGTLIMPYCSGFANLIFAYVMSSSAANGGLVIENCLVNNATNLTLILGLAAIFGSAAVVKKSGGSKQKATKHSEFHRINKLNLLFTLIALFLFTGTLWALAKDGTLDFYDGLVLVGLFLFWQILHVFEVLKDNIRKNKAFHWTIMIDLALLGISAYGVYYSVDHLVTWVSTTHNPYFSFAKLGWFSGLLMVVPNAFLALYYTRTGRQDIVLTSQVGDGHICIPMCIGLFAVFNPIQVPAFFQMGTYIILGAGVVNFLSIAILGRVPRPVGYGLIGGYAVFLYMGLIQ
ncbi:sodium/calcium exchanger protein [mine drainage metagenome]|uniref:Sodium/calcium exchanger protein n=1 Tax=mine drainage metagenome TaxID=410659 RepID=A0A1J5TE60_9ZZZZ